MSRGSIFSFHKVPRVLYKLHNSFAMTKGVQCIFVPKQFSYPFIIVIAEKNGREERARKKWRLKPTGSTRPFYYVGRISIRTIYPGWDRVSQGRKDDRSRRRNIGSVPRRYAIGSSVRIKTTTITMKYFELFHSWKSNWQLCNAQSYGVKSFESYPVYLMLHKRKNQRRNFGLFKVARVYYLSITLWP